MAGVADVYYTNIALISDAKDEDKPAQAAAFEALLDAVDGGAILYKTRATQVPSYYTSKYCVAMRQDVMYFFSVVSRRIAFPNSTSLDCRSRVSSTRALALCPSLLVMLHIIFHAKNPPAAQFIPQFASFFPGLAEKALTKLLDLVEDADAAVHGKAIGALPQLCVALPQYVGKVADVLGQLLLSDIKADQAPAQVRIARCSSPILPSAALSITNCT